VTSKAQQIEELEVLLAERQERELYSRLDFLKPYPWQQNVLGASKSNKQTLLMAANRVGKSYIGAANISYHLTGLYPDWWTGHIWKEPINAWAAGVSSESTRDILQNELLGVPEDPERLGTGAIPKACIGERTRKPQIPNGVQAVMVRHHTNGVFDGWSKLTFKAFEQGEQKFMGSSIHEIWLDEQPPDGLFTQCITRTANTAGHVTMTFTPEDGMTPVIHQFMNNRQKGQCLLQATWEDAPHITKEVKDQLLAVYSEHERDMRSKGIPLFGSGPVFMVPDEDLAIDPFEIPEYWPCIIGLDIGWEHPTAVVWLRWDRESDTMYVVDCYRQNKATVAVHAGAISARDSAPVAWPHDGMIHEKGSGVTMADQYRAHGIQMLPSWFTNPLAVGEPGKGNYKVEPGINAMHEAMQQGRFKVFKTCTDWFSEYRLYHRDDGKIVAIDDDLMSATRYAFQSRRFAELPLASANGYRSGFSKQIKYTKLQLV
jgi:phage terminase large subunit-like protein